MIIMITMIIVIIMIISPPPPHGNNGKGSGLNVRTVSLMGLGKGHCVKFHKNGCDGD